MLSILILGIILRFCGAVTLEHAEEGPCLNPPPTTVPYDAEAFANTSVTWYHQIWSRYYLYRVAADVTRKDFKNIRESELENSCLKFSATGPGTVTVSGFNGLQRVYELGGGNSPDTFQWKASGQSDWEAESWVTKADADYFVVVTCFTTNQRSFTVASKTKTLHPQTRADIIQHLESLGFSRNYFFEPNNAACHKSDATSTNENKGYVYSEPRIPFKYPSFYLKK